MGFQKRCKFGTHLGRGRVCYQEGDYAGASAWFAAALNLAETPAEVSQALYGAACACSARGDHRGASDYFEAARRRSPYDAEILYGLGLTYQHMCENDKAIECYEEAIRLKPDYALPYCSLGAIKIASGSYGDAIGFLKQSLLLHPDLPEALYNLSSAYVYLEDYTLAMRTCERLLRVQPVKQVNTQLYDLIRSLQDPEERPAYSGSQANS